MKYWDYFRGHVRLGAARKKRNRGRDWVDEPTVDNGFPSFSGTDPALPNNALFYQVVKPVVEARRTLLKYDRLYVLWQAARNVHHMQLAAAEVGSYRGGSAYFLASALRVLAGAELPVHVFDTFEGHPPKTHPEFDPVHKPGMFSETSYEDVKKYLSAFTRVEIHKGEFSCSVQSLPNMRFGLAHIDVDLYRSTLDCLEYFGARLAPGGVIVVDDYGAEKCPGVQKAVSEYLPREDRFQVWHMRTEQVVLVKAYPAKG